MKRKGGKQSGRDLPSTTSLGGWGYIIGEGRIGARPNYLLSTYMVGKKEGFEPGTGRSCGLNLDSI